jgi:serine/threonine-protein kinase
VFRRRADGAGAEETLWSGTQHVHVDTVTADGRALILTVSDVAGGQPDLMLLPLEGDHTLKPLLQSKFAEAGARLSPDGRWLAYYSNETGRDEVYVRAYPSLEGKTQVSTGGGRQPVWSKKGDELFFRGEGAMMAVRVGPGAPLSVTAPRKLFEDRYYTKGLAHTGYDVSRDGRFLMVKDPSAGQAASPANTLPQTNFIVVLNWFEELKQKLQAR